MEMIDTKVEVVTPDRAKAWLETMVTNRPLTQRVVSFYAEQMQRGHWKVNGEALKFDSSGRLIDGQHRLNAVIRAKTPVRMMVVRGLAEDSFETLDSGKRRGPGDVLGISGEKNSAVLASGARWACYLTGEVKHNQQVPNQVVLRAVENTPELRVWCSRYAGNGKIKALLPSAAISVFALGSRRYGDDLVMTFFTELSEGVGITKGDPAYELRERMIVNRGSVSKLQTRTIIAFTVKAMNAFVLNKKIGVLRWRDEEDFPAMV